MKFEAKRTSVWIGRPMEEAVNTSGKPDGDWDAVWEVEINSLEELMALIKKYDEPIIVFDDRIEIYDGYRE